MDNPPVRIIDPATGREFNSKRRQRFDEERMPRELTFSCFQRLPLLNRDRSCLWFADALNETRTHWPVDLWAWVIMPEHVHVLVAPRETKVAVGRFQGEVKERTARPAIAWLEQHAPAWLSRLTVREGTRVRRRFWQPGGGYDRNIDHYDTLLVSINYIHMNPVKRGLVERPEDWPWSSARWYAGIRPVVVEMDATFPES
jgi:putative transposase